MCSDRREAGDAQKGRWALREERKTIAGSRPKGGGPGSGPPPFGRGATSGLPEHIVYDGCACRPSRPAILTYTPAARAGHIDVYCGRFTSTPEKQKNLATPLSVWAQILPLPPFGPDLGPKGGGPDPGPPPFRSSPRLRPVTAFCYHARNLRQGSSMLCWTSQTQA